MRRSLKTLGPALLATLVLGAIGVQAAAAKVNHEFVVQGKAPAVLTGFGESQVFTFGGAPVVCPEVKLGGTMKVATEDKIKLFPEYPGKCSIGSVTMTVANTGCTFELNSDTETTEGETHAPVRMEKTR